MFGLRDGGGGGDEGKKKLVPKWASHCWVSIQNFIFPGRKFFLVLGGGWFGLGGVGPPDRLRRDKAHPCLQQATGSTSGSLKQTLGSHLAAPADGVPRWCVGLGDRFLSPAERHATNAHPQVPQPHLEVSGRGRGIASGSHRSLVSALDIPPIWGVHKGTHAAYPKRGSNLECPFCTIIALRGKSVPQKSPKSQKTFNSVQCKPGERNRTWVWDGIAATMGTPGPRGHTETRQKEHTRKPPRTTIAKQHRTCTLPRGTRALERTRPHGQRHRTADRLECCSWGGGSLIQIQTPGQRRGPRVLSLGPQMARL